MGILIRNRQNRHRIATKKLKRMIQVILNALDFPDAELSILLVDDSEIEELNRKYLNREGPTNVIAFPMQEGDFAHISPQLLGDVVVSVDTARKEAETGGIHVDERLLELLVHGILHLVGYDHELSETEALRMEAKSNELLALVKNIA
ncbi:MAG: rRNA maturation RNase YbeY [Deltaproteobacteria bacterium]|nr:MAG: rRNA maturation RNase YbeY [Deltaproteobacteria bacterium]